MLEDLAFLRKRWSLAEAEANIRLFSHKWGVINDDRSFGGIREFVREHVGRIDPLRAGAPAQPDRETPMRREELCQTRSDLLDLALRRGYVAAELRVIDAALDLARTLSSGGYRPCGRPFLNHLVGTASALVRYGFRAETVAAGLLHSAYSHAPAHPPGLAAQADAVCARLGGRDNAVERRVRAYTLRDSTWSMLGGDADALSTLSVFEAEVLALAAANEVDMHFSGEVRYSGRTDTLDPAMLPIVTHVCRMLGVPGLAATLQSLLARQPAPVLPELVTSSQGSYRIGADGGSRTPMAGDVPTVLHLPLG